MQYGAGPRSDLGGFGSSGQPTLQQADSYQQSQHNSNDVSGYKQLI